MPIRLLALTKVVLANKGTPPIHPARCSARAFRTPAVVGKGDESRDGRRDEIQINNNKSGIGDGMSDEITIHTMKSGRVDGMSDKITINNNESGRVDGMSDKITL